jgi:hypothetical protein
LEPGWQRLFQALSQVTNAPALRRAALGGLAAIGIIVKGGTIVPSVADCDLASKTPERMN